MKVIILCNISSDFLDLSIPILNNNVHISLEKNVLFEKLYEIYKIETVPDNIWGDFEKRFCQLYEMWLKQKTNRYKKIK